MREILFRGKCVDTGLWVYGNFVADATEQLNGCNGADGFIRAYNPTLGKSEMFEVERETVGQYTGLTDKNGKKIFEGDIVTADALFENRKVDFVDNTYWSAFCLVAANDDCDYMNEYGGIEVIGNIYDNPELVSRKYGGADDD